MTSEPERLSPRLSWRESAERLLEGVPGVVSATIEGTQHSVSGVRVWYEPTWPVGQVMEAVHKCLTDEAKARLTATRFHAVVEHADRRLERRPRPARAPTPPAHLGSTPTASAPLRLVGYKIDEMQEGVIGVQVWIEWQGRTFSGAAVGPDIPPGSVRTPALATLRALHSCLQILYEGPMQPGLALERALQVTVQGSPVAVVSLTASENARPRSLTSAWPDEGAPGLAMILATLNAASRTVTRWLSGERPSEGSGLAATEQRFTLVDFEVDRRPSGDFDVGVRLTGNGGAVNGRRNGSDNDEARLHLSAAATLDAVRELLRLGGWSERHGEDLRYADTQRLRIGEQEVVVVLAEALLKGHRVPLAGATSADLGLERASITAMLQATNLLVADRTARMMWSARADGIEDSTRPVRACRLATNRQALRLSLVYRRWTGP